MTTKVINLVFHNQEIKAFAHAKMLKNSNKIPRYRIKVTLFWDLGREHRILKNQKWST